MIFVATLRSYKFKVGENVVVKHARISGKFFIDVCRYIF